MQDWVVISLAALVYSLVMYAFNRVFKVDEHAARMRDLAKRMQNDPNSITDEEIVEHTKQMYKVMGVRLLMVFIVFYPLYYAFSSRYGDVQTPLGTMGWIWWFLLSSIAVQIVIGGVKKWLAP